MRAAERCWSCAEAGEKRRSPMKAKFGRRSGQSPTLQNAGPGRERWRSGPSALQRRSRRFAAGTGRWRLDLGVGFSDCASPLALWMGRGQAQSGRGLPHSKALRAFGQGQTAKPGRRGMRWVAAKLLRSRGDTARIALPLRSIAACQLLGPMRLTAVCAGIGGRPASAAVRRDMRRKSAHHFWTNIEHPTSKFGSLTFDVRRAMLDVRLRA